MLHFMTLIFIVTLKVIIPKVFIVTLKSDHQLGENTCFIRPAFGLVKVPGRLATHHYWNRARNKFFTWT